MKGFLVMLGICIGIPIAGYIIFVIIVPACEWCYKKIHNFFLLCPQWVQNIKNSIKKGVKTVILILLTIFMLVGWCFLLFDSCTNCSGSHDYEDYEYINDGHRPDHF